MTSKGLVFLVEDDDDLRMNLEFMLKHLGYEVSDFDSAVSFLQKARRHSPAVLVMDMRMPQMSGLDLHKALLEKDWSLPIIYMSGESQSQEIIDAMKFGAIEFLWKPFPHSKLIQAIDKGLKQDADRHDDQKRLLLVDSLHKDLNPREQSILSLMLLGHGNKHIASVKGLMADTIKKYRGQILSKMQVNSLAELLALCKGYIPRQKCYECDSHENTPPT
jgi:FixJ family two-component response regulator